MQNKQVSTLVHRDLSKENILYYKDTNTATLLDWENAIITDYLYELSNLPWLYFQIIPEEKIVSLLREFANTEVNRKRLVALVVYNAVQSISIYDKKSDHYKNALNYATILTDRIIHLLLSSSGFVPTLKVEALATVES